MKAAIDENGKLKITPENGIESFALKMWWEDYMKGEALPTDTGETKL